MDLSNLSNDELMSLKNGDYSKLSNETLLALKGSAAPPEPSGLSKLGQMAGTAGMIGLEVLKAPNELAGEAVKYAAEGGRQPFRLPTVMQRLDPIEGQIPLPGTPYGYQVTNQKPPTNLVEQITGGLQGIAAGAAAPFMGQNPIEAAAAEIRRPKNTLPDLINQMAFTLAAPGIANAPLDASLKAAGAVLPVAGKAAAQLSSAFTNVPPSSYETVFNNPSALMPGRLAAAGQQFEEAKNAAGVTKGAVRTEALTNSEPYVFALEKKIDAGVPVTPEEALYGRQAIDKIMPLPTQKNANYRNLLIDMRNKFQGALAGTPLEGTSAEYSTAKAGNNFLSPVPLTSTGKPAFVRTAAMLGSAMEGHPLASLAASPIVAGGLTGLTGLAAKPVMAFAQNSAAKAALLAALLANKRK